MHSVFIVSQTLTGAWQSYGAFMLQTVAVLVLIAIGAWAVVRFGAPRLQRGNARGRMRVVERLWLEPRRSLYLVEVDGKELLIGVSEGSVRLVTPLSELAPAPGCKDATNRGGEEP